MVGIGLLIAWIAYWKLMVGPTEFDGVIWRQGENASGGPRLRMADGLLQSRVLVGRTRSEVESMLGIPRKTEYFQEYDLVYRLGMERGFISIDSEWLVLRLGKDGRVSDARIVSD